MRQDRARPAGRAAAMPGMTCLVTGATSGIGKETALRLAALGATVVIVARDAARGAAAGRRSPGACRCPGRGHDRGPGQPRAGARLAGRSWPARAARCPGQQRRRDHDAPRLTADGFETTFATNHLGPFLLTSLLRGLLERSAPARVVTVSSAAHKQARAIPWDDLPRGAQSGQGQAYPVSKLLNILFTAELARRLAGTGVTANCLHPGFVRTALGRDVTGVLGAVLPLVLRVTPGPAAGARTPVYLASSPDVAGVTGGYFVNCKPAQPSSLARDAQAAARLWALSEDLAGLRTPPSTGSRA